MSEKMKLYFDDISKNVHQMWELTDSLRKKGLDAVDSVEIPIAKNMAERVEGLISVVAPQIKGCGMVERIHELEKEYGKLDWRVALIVSEEIANEKFCKFKDKHEAMEVGIRVGIAYVTNGVVASPLEGFTHLKFRKRKDGKEYASLSFSGPIRSAGGTGASVSVIIGDYIRKKMGYAAYDPEENEIKRMVTELYDYHEKVTNLQYLPSPQEIEYMVRHLEVQIDGDPSEKYDVSNYKDLPRMETNKIRNGICLVIGEGLCQKAPKLWKQLGKWGKDFGMEHWFFLEEFLKLQKTIKSKEKKTTNAVEAKIKPDYTFIKDIVAGRPVLTHPLRVGGLRLRYGRARNTGLSSMAIHPATMVVVNDYIAIGTQLKVERPSKGCALSSCDSIEGPIVKLKDQSVVFLDSYEKAKNYFGQVEEILFLGDLLIGYGDFFNRAHILVPPGYCEEWWVLELEKGIVDRYGKLDFAELAKETEIDSERLSKIFKNNAEDVSFLLAKQLGLFLNIPLHPRWTYHWKDINKKQFESLTGWLRKGEIADDGLVLPLIYDLVSDLKEEDPKRVLELLGIPHKVIGKEKVVIEKEDKDSLLLCLNNLEFFDVGGENGLEIINQISKIKIKDKSGLFIGARMGRPEKAKMRKLTGSPQTLFPVGAEGGKMRSFQAALEKGFIKGDFPIYVCECGKENIYPYCISCKKKTEKRFYCKECGILEKQCEKLDKQGKKHNSFGYRNSSLDIKEYFQAALEQLQLQEYPKLIKGVRGTSNEDHTPENLVKGILRAIHELYVNKDGTIRYDATELSITAFTPEEIDTNIEKLKSLGYDKDIYGNEIIDEKQIIELKCQDVILPGQETGEEGSDDVLFRVSKFIDDLLLYYYKVDGFYNLKSRKDLAGHLILAIAPHISAGTVCRIIGFSKTQGFYAHPMLHCAVRRDCVHPHTKFVYSDNLGKVGYEKIGEHVENLLARGANTRVIDDFGTIAVETNKEIYAYGEDPDTKNLVKKRIKYFVKGPLQKEWIKITTATNRNFIMTPTHKFMYLDSENNFRFKEAFQCKIGDKLLVSDYFKPEVFYKELNLIKEFIDTCEDNVLRRIRIVNGSDFFKFFVKKITKRRLVEICSLPQSCLRYKNLHEWYDSVSLLNIKELALHGLLTYEDLPRGLMLRFNFGRARFRSYLTLNINLARLLGYFTAEGHLRSNKTTKQISFRNNDKNIQNEIAHLIKEIFGVEPIFEEDTKITIANSLIYYIFRDVLKTGSNAKEKRAPPILYNCEDSMIANYVSTYIDGDGSIVNERKCITFYSVNRSLLDDIAFLLTRFNIASRYISISPRIPGRLVLNKYLLKGEIKKFPLHHLAVYGEDAFKLGSVLILTKKSKREKLQVLMQARFGERHLNDKPLISFGDSFVDYIKTIEIVYGENNSYCLEVDWIREEEKNIIWGEQIVNTRCDGDEVAFMLLMDAYINFSRKYLPAHRGATQDAPLVLSSMLIPSEIDDMAFDVDLGSSYGLEFYNACEMYKMPWDVKIEQLKSRLGKPEQYEGWRFTHHTSNINNGVLCSAYKSIPSMQEKVFGQINIAEKIRAVDESDVARLVIERHFIRDIRGNLRKFSTQEFRCVNCNEKYRRPPLLGCCLKCNGRIVFTVAEGSVIKYLEPCLSLAEKFELPAYLRQNLALTKMRIESVFGKEKERQEGLGKWF